MNTFEIDSQLTQEEIEMSARLVEKAQTLTVIDPKVANECFITAYYEEFLPKSLENDELSRKVFRSEEFRQFIKTPIVK